MYILSLIREKMRPHLIIVYITSSPIQGHYLYDLIGHVTKNIYFENYLEQGTSNISLIRLHTLIHKGNQGSTILAMACLIMNIV